MNTIPDADIRPIANEDTTGSMKEHLVGALGRVIPRDVRIATAYLTPDGFLELKDASPADRQRFVKRACFVGGI